MRNSETTERIDGLEPEALARIAAALKDIIEEIADAFVRTARAVVRFARKLAKRLDLRWQRRYRHALARSRRNNLYLKSIGRCR